MISLKMKEWRMPGTFVTTLWTGLMRHQFLVNISHLSMTHRCRAEDLFCFNKEVCLYFQVTSEKSCPRLSLHCNSHEILWQTLWNRRTLHGAYKMQSQEQNSSKLHKSNVIVIFNTYYCNFCIYICETEIIMNQFFR